MYFALFCIVVHSFGIKRIIRKTIVTFFLLNLTIYTKAFILIFKLVQRPRFDSSLLNKLITVLLRSSLPLTVSYIQLIHSFPDSDDTGHFLSNGQTHLWASLALRPVHTEAHSQVSIDSGVIYQPTHPGHRESISQDFSVWWRVDRLFSFSSVGRRESHDAVRACISMPCPGMSLSEIQGHADIIGDPKVN